MALSGNINSTTFNGRTYRISWSASQSTEGNYSVITCNHYLINPSGYDLYINGRSNTCTVNGETKSYSSPAISTGGGSTIHLGTTSHTVYHNADGSKSVSISGTFNIQATLGGYYVSSVSASGTVTLDAIPRAATVFTAPNFTDEDNPTITYSNKAGTAVGTLQACISDAAGYEIFVPYRDISKTGTSYTFNLTAAEREALQKAVLSGSDNRQVRFYIKTTIGSTTLYSSLQKTLTIANAKPTIIPTVIDTNDKTLALTGDENILVRYHSNVAASIKATFKKYATAKTYSIASGNATFTTATGTFNAVERSSFAFRVVDTRGLTASQTITKDFVEYVRLTCNLEVTRPNALGEMSLKINGNYFKGSFGAEDNSLTLFYSYQAEGGEPVVVPVTVTPSEKTYSATIQVTGLDYRKKYLFKAWAEDKLEKANSAEIETYTLPVFDWDKNSFNFNVPISFNDVRMNDFVIEEGKMSGWNFRRWNSGIGECWFITEPTNLSISTAWGGLYTKDDAFPGYSYPFEFTSLPVVSVQPYTTDGNFWCFTGSDASTTQSPSVSVVRPTSYSVTGARISMYVIGRWK